MAEQMSKGKDSTEIEAEADVRFMAETNQAMMQIKRWETCGYRDSARAVLAGVGFETAVGTLSYERRYFVTLY